METEKPPKKRLTPMAALEKAKSHCAYQERCQQEMRDALYDWGLYSADVENVLVTLIEEGFLNEERFAKAYAGGKFRIKHWGRKKIVYALKQKRISSYCINKALLEIPDEDYQKVFDTEFESYWEKLSEKNPLKRKAKVLQYFSGRGFEQELIWEALNSRTK